MSQYQDLANRLEHLHSLTRLAEKTVVEAKEQAKDVKIGAQKKAEARAATIITRAEAEAKEEAERIIAEVQQRAEVSAQEKISLAEQ